MPKKRYRPEEIISKLREADVLISQGKPDSRRACQSAALWRSSTTRGFLGSLGGLGLLRLGRVALTILSGATRRVSAPILPFPKAPLGPREISTICSR